MKINQAFKSASARQTAALMPYLTLGYPDIERSLQLVEAIAPFSDLIELGVPFSDPLADGKTIQNSTQIALENGVTSRKCVEMVFELRRRGVKAPLLMMGYFNPILAYGEANYVRDMATAGANGLIVPDLPPEEAGELQLLAADAGIHLIHFLTPTSSPARIKQVVEQATGFIYMVSVAGITGARSTLAEELPRFVAQIKSQTKVPVAVGFGISTPELARQAGRFADGVIVGSALINAIDAESQDKPAAAAQFVASMQAAMMESAHE